MDRRADPSGEAAMIVLVRHGRSGHVHSGLLNAAQFRRWRELYEAAGIAADDVPPASLQTTVASAGMLVASPAARTVASAKRLAPGRALVTSELLRELELPAPDLGRVRLPLVAWMLLVGLRSRTVAPAEAERARAAAEWLARLSAEHGTVVAVTHGAVRRAIAMELRTLGWRDASPSRRIHHWSAWAFSPR